MMINNNFRLLNIQETVINTNIPLIQERRIIFTVGKNTKESLEIRVSTLVLANKPFRKDDISLKWFISGVGEDVELVASGIPTSQFIALVTEAKPKYKNILQSIVDNEELLMRLQCIKNGY